jgi:hypothetical protein
MNAPAAKYDDIKEKVREKERGGRRRKDWNEGATRGGSNT